MPDGLISSYREILTPDGRELIGTEYPDDGYCWFDLTRAAMKAGFTHDQIFEAEQASRELLYSDAYIAAHLAELGVS
jgi:hypothetical protein